MATKSATIPVPISGFGPAVDVSDMVGDKTVFLSGSFRGDYVLYGTHDGKRYVPLMIFDTGGVEAIQQVYSGALRKVRMFSAATEVTGVGASISGLLSPANNSFAAFGVLGSGAQGPQTAVDLGVSKYQVGLNFMAEGGLRGMVVVEGSIDGSRFNPIGSFSAEPAGRSLLGGNKLEFSPLGTQDKVRYVRLNVLGKVLDTFVVTIGGSQNNGGVGRETLHEAYNVGRTSFDQTLNLSKAKGGKVVFDASDPGFSDPYMVEMLGLGGTGGAFLQYGGMVLGPDSILIGTPSGSAFAVGLADVVVGTMALVGGNRNVAIGPAVAVGSLLMSVMGADDVSVSIRETARCQRQPWLVRSART